MKKLAVFLCAAVVVIAGLLFAKPEAIPFMKCAYAEGAGGSCEFCPPNYCVDVAKAKVLKERKKAYARSQGLPERYLQFWDRLDDCEACVANSPDWVHIMYVYDKDGFEKEYGHKAPFTSHSLPWTADLELKLRDEMRRGVVKEIHIIHYGNKPCKCCRARSKKEYQAWFDGELDSDDQDAKGYNKEHDFHPDAAISWTSPSQLGPDPKDLTEIPESYKRGTELKAPPVSNFMTNEPPQRIVHVMCEKCRKLEEEYNKYARWINEEQRPIAQKRRSLYFDRQGIDDVMTEIYGLGKAANTPENEKKSEDLFKELSDREQQYDRDKRKLDEALDKVREWKEKLADLMRKILACEESCTTPVEDPKKAMIKSDGAEENEKAAMDSGGEKSALPDNKTKAVPDKKMSGGACKKAPKAPSIAIGPNSKYGTGAQTKKKVAETVGGALLGGLMGGGSGGGGLNMGGGGMGMVPGPMGGGGKSQGPKTVKDPVPKTAKMKMAPTSAGTEMTVGGAFNDKGLVISSMINEAPGKGTFHAVYLEDCNGQRRMPKEYLIFDLWQDWKLTVWWTHDRWIDGEHVLHEEGEYYETGKNPVGTFFFYKKGNEAKGIWNLLGFDNATNGIRSLGTVFNVTPADLANGPLNLVIHTTLPKGDIVKTDPQIFRISADPKAKGGVSISRL